MRGDMVPLRDYVDQGLTGLQNQLDRRMGEAQRETEGRIREQSDALQAAATALDKRLSAMNEFREQIRDVTARKVDTDLYRQAFESVNIRMEAIESVLDRQRGRWSAYTAVGSVLIVAVAILTLILNNVHL